MMQCHSLVWFSSHVLRHSFITWLGLHGRLKTKGKVINGVLLRLLFVFNVMAELNLRVISFFLVFFLLQFGKAFC